MGDRKVAFKFFSIPQYWQEEEYLSSMHERGWKLTGIICSISRDTVIGRYKIECSGRRAKGVVRFVIK